MESNAQEQEDVTTSAKLTEAQKARIEKNKMRAIHLRQAKLVPHPYAMRSNLDPDAKVIKIQGSKFIDSGGGFLLEEKIGDGDKNKEIQNATSEPLTILDDILAIPIQYEECVECGDKFADSYLFNKFGYYCCDKCRDQDDKHCLITKTEAKSVYLLKDCDLELREPILKFITRANPHNSRWGDMKLYLHLQVEQRAMEVWGSEEELEKQKENRTEKRENGKVKKFNKRMKELRMDMRSSLYDKTKNFNHTHEFGPETYNEAEDNYSHSCLTCDYIEVFEKM